MITIRAMAESDMAFIRGTWLDHQMAQRYFKKTPRTILKKNLAPVIDALISSSLVIVACSEEEENQIMGYAVYNLDSLHFIYTKLVYRNFGIFKKMISEIDAKFDNYTAFTEDRSFLDYAKKNKMIFNPWAINESIKIEIGRIN